SGVLNSVHAFATDPQRGMFILALLVIVVGTSLAIYAWRAPRLAGGGRFELLSRETLLLLNNAVLTVAAATVLAGTLYPMATDALGLGKISVGPPYFNTVFIPLMLPLLALLGVGVLVRWKRHDARGLLHTLRWAALAAVIAAVVTAWWFTGMHPMGVLGVALAIWMLWASVQAVIERVRGRRDRVRALRGIPRGFWGMTLAHTGLAVFVLGVSAVGNFDWHSTLRLAPGESYQAAGYTWRLEDVSTVEGPNYTAKQGTVVISRDGEVVTTLYPQKRRYPSSGMRVMTEAGIDGGLVRDLFVALGKPREDGSWTLRVQYKPMLRWVWYGALIMAVGGLLGATDPRYRRLLDRERRAALARG
ncbi:cytochrome c-type biogenesis CcmF C-terminal domain-containing protein, partial [Arhodomonas sp. KWT]